MSSLPEITAESNPVCVVGRYALYGKLASGGMATVHFGRLVGPVGFSRTVAIKRLHPEFAKDPQFVNMFLDEARVAARIQHPNVVATLDIVSTEDELFLVMDYVRGESFSRLNRVARKKGLALPEGFAAGVVAGMLHGLHAAHEATDERGKPLKVVHRDVSPQNVLVGVDGIARVLDFGVAKAAARVQVTRAGQMKGKLSYMSPEQLQGRSVDRRSDVFAAGIVLWEALTGQRLFAGDEVRDVLKKIVSETTPPPSQWNPRVSAELDRLVLRALQKDPDLRFQSAREFAIALEETVPLMSARETGEWVEEIAGDSLEQREAALAEIESVSSVSEVLTEPALLKAPSRGLMQVPAEPSAPTSSLAGLPPPKPSAQSASRRRVTPPALPQPSTSRPPPPPRRRAGALDPGVGSGETVSEMPDEPTLVFNPMALGDVTSPKHRSPVPPAHPSRALKQAPARRRAFVLGALLVASVLGGLGVARWISQSSETSQPAQQATPERGEPGAGSPVTAAPRAELTQAPDTSPGGSAVALEIDSLPKLSPAQPKSSARVEGSMPSGAGSDGPAGKARPIAPSRARCTPPWTVDSNGIRRIKPGCL